MFGIESGTIIPSPDYLKNSRSRSTALTLILIQVRLINRVSLSTIMQTGNDTVTNKKPLLEEIHKTNRIKTDAQGD